MQDLGSALEQFGRELINTFQHIDFSPILPVIREVIQTFISRNFSEGGRYGSENIFGGGGKTWTVSKRALKKNGQTLRDTGQLAASIFVNILQNGNDIVVEVGSNKPYAAIHQFGGEIKRAASSRLYKQNRYKRGPKKGQYKKGTTFGQGATTGPYTIKILARPYMVIQNEDLEEIEQIIQIFIMGTLV